MDYVRYLKSKRTVDDRALNERVLRDAEQYVQGLHACWDQSCPLRIVEVGAGVGAMCCRLFLRGTFSKFKRVEYLLIDFKSDAIVAARNSVRQLRSPSTETSTSGSSELAQRAEFYGHVSNMTIDYHRRTSGAEDSGGEQDLSDVRLDDCFFVSFAICDALEYARSHVNRFDIVIGAAVLDLWELTTSVPLLLSMLRADGLKVYYFPINFDGTTSLLPVTNEGVEFDGNVEADFHRAMGHHTVSMTDSGKCRIPAAHTGRQLLPILTHVGAQVRSTGSSGWIVLPHMEKAGFYADDEKYFLRCIIDFIETSVPRVRCDGKDEKWYGAFDRYIRERRGQLERGELCYIAHNIDVFGTYCG